MNKRTIQGRRTVGLLLVAVFTVASCSSTPRASARGAVSVSISPDPIIAIRTGADEWRFPCVVEIRETGGVDVTIDVVVVRVTLNRVRIYEQVLQQDDLRGLGHATQLSAGGLLRYEFDMSRRIPDPNLISRIEAEMELRGHDFEGRSVSARRAIQFSFSP